MRKLGYIAIPLGLICGGVSMAPLSEREVSSSKEEVRDLRYVSNHLSSIDDIPREFHFGDQLVPVHEEGVRYKLKRQLNRFSKYTYGNKLIARRLGRYEETFRSILREMGVPEDFVYLAITESNLSNAVSPVGACGFWQFMPATARQYGLEVSSTVDERYHPEKATYAAAQYLTDAYEEFEDWFLVAAAYNMGPGGVSRALRRQEDCSYFELDLNKETGQYVYKILAYKIIFNSPLRYGHSVSAERLYQPIAYRPVVVDKNIRNLSKFAAQHGTDLPTLKKLNPWLVSHSLYVKKGKTYEIRIPLDENLRMDELAVDDYRPSVTKAIEDKVDTLSTVESLVQDAETPAPPKAAQDSTKQV